MVDEDRTSPPAGHSRPRAALAATLLLVAAIGLVLVAQFPLDGWAEASSIHHQLQHGLIFAAGIGVGVALTVLYRAGRPPAHRGEDPSPG